MNPKTIVDKMISTSFKTETGWGDSFEDRHQDGVGFAHVPARGSLEVLFLQDAPVTFTGHYVDGRMKPCVHNGCTLCAKGIGTQRRWVFAVYECARGATRLLELGASPANQLQHYAIDYQGLLGLRFRFSKPGGTLRSTITVDLTGSARVPESELPTCPDTAELMRKIWTDQTTKKLIS